MDHPRALIAVAVLCACAPAAPPPHGEILVNVDTDLPVVRAVSQLRVDSYAGDGRWFDSRTIGLPDAESWPVSFSVYSDDDRADKLLWLRLRAFSDGAVRDYRGERFTSPSFTAPPPAGDGPRLLGHGADVTPALEPLPALTVDRLVLLRLSPGRRRSVSLVLAGVCAGRMSRLSEAGTPSAGSESCESGEPAVVSEASLTEGIVRQTQSQVGSWSEPCDGSGDADRVCVPGGATIMGSRELLVYPDLPPTPERVVYLSRFWVDRNEVSVGRFRAALDAGLPVSDLPRATLGTLGPDFVQNGCSWTPTVAEREDFALSCVSQPTARKFCQFMGGDLPSEAQWEYMATSAGRSQRMPFPWGDTPPTCDAAVYGRLSLSGLPGVCQDFGSGPLPLWAGPGDASPLGIAGLGGGVSEWLRDAYADYGAPCWRHAPLVDPQCQEAVAERSVRGGSWAAPPTILRSAGRMGVDGSGEASFIGFRCAYPGTS